MAEKFSGGTAGSRDQEGGSDAEENGGEGKNQIVSDIRKKYEKKLAVLRDGGSESVCTMSKVIHLGSSCI